MNTNGKEEKNKVITYNPSTQEIVEELKLEDDFGFQLVKFNNNLFGINYINPVKGIAETVMVSTDAGINITYLWSDIIMREEVIVELARKHLDEHVTVYFRNEYVKGRWVEVDLHTRIISLIPVGKPHNRITIDYSEITAIEYEDVK